MTNPKGNKSITRAVLGRLKFKEKPERTKRTLVLTKTSYEQFERICRSEKRYPSEVIDEFISLFIEESEKR